MPLAEAPAWFAADRNRERGEFVLIVDAPASAVASAGRARSGRRPVARRAAGRTAAGARGAHRRVGHRRAARRRLRARAGAQAGE